MHRFNFGLVLASIALCSCSHRAEDCAALNGAVAKIPPNLEVPSKAGGEHASRAQSAKAESRAAAAALDGLNSVQVKANEGKDLMTQLAASLARCRDIADKLAAANDVMAAKAEELSKLPGLSPELIGKYRKDVLLTNVLLKAVPGVPDADKDVIIAAVDNEFGKGPKVSTESPSKDLDAMADRVSKCDVKSDKGKAAAQDLATFLRAEAGRFRTAEKVRAELLPLERDETALLQQAADANAGLKKAVADLKQACAAK